VLIECADHADPTEQLALAVAEIDPVDTAIATDARQREALWRYREGHPEAVNAAGRPLKLDVAVPLTELAQFEADLRATVESLAPTAQLILFGHLGEGNLHVNVLGVANGADLLTQAVLKLVVSRSGSICAEHGVGRAKAAWAHLSRSATDLAAMRNVKTALDPNWLLNPGVIFTGR
jgi:FAD/FMN-containing dehydrogenase